jgi:PPOX class probable F420-dependent enzyme
MTIPTAVRELIDRGPIAHVVTLNEDGSPHVSVAWVGIEDDEVVIGTLPEQAKLRNLRRNPRIALSMLSGERNPWGLDEYVVLHGRARVTEGGAAPLLQRLALTYVGPDAQFPPMPDPPPGYVIRISVDKIVGVGPWTTEDGPDATQAQRR